MSDTTTNDPMTASFSVTERAAARIGEIVSQQPDPDGLMLRVAVLAGGCNGFQYQFKLEREQAADDAVFGDGPSRVVVDPVSLDLLGGAALDFSDKLMGAHFSVINPNAASSCGCGTSFSLA
jgi:iron-sulfur cluster insertion protein